MLELFFHHLRRYSVCFTGMPDAVLHHDCTEPSCQRWRHLVHLPRANREEEISPVVSQVSLLALHLIASILCPSQVRWCIDARQNVTGWPSASSGCFVAVDALPKTWVMYERLGGLARSESRLRPLLIDVFADVSSSWPRRWQA